jgi:hypothetical protein
MAFLAHQGHLQVPSPGPSLESIAIETDEAVEAESAAAPAFRDLQKKYKKNKVDLEKVLKEHAVLKQELDQVSSARAVEAAKKADLESSHQETLKSLRMIKLLHNQAISDLEVEKNKYKEKSPLWDADKGRLQGEVFNLQGQPVDMYNKGFVPALQQVRVVAPNLDTSMLSSQLAVRDGRHVAHDVGNPQGIALA